MTFTSLGQYLGLHRRGVIASMLCYTRFDIETSLRRSCVSQKNVTEVIVILIKKLHQSRTLVTTSPKTSFSCIPNVVTT